MVTTPIKRTASSSPDGSRPTKRLATSSPEEGELDDAVATTPSGSHSVVPHKLDPTVPSPTRPSLNASEKFESKVPFPFKRKQNESSSVPPTIPKDKIVYERSPRTADRFREAEERSFRLSARPVHDRWEPQYRPPHPYSHLDDRRRHHPRREAFDPRDRPPARSTRPSDYPPRRDHDKPRSTPSSDRSRSTTPKHRLPPRASVSPPDDRRGSYDRGYDQYVPRGHDYVPNDRHYRPGRDYPPARMETYEYAGRSRNDRRTHDSWRPSDNYRPRSPSPQRHEDFANTPPRPFSSSPRSLRTPPRPLSPYASRSPPPPPLEPPPLPPTDESLLKEHTAISFIVPSKKPQAPKHPHSPPSFIPPETDNKELVELDTIKDADTVIISHRIQKHVVKRSRKEEEEAYGRTFQGCGSIADYDITTKLGEGTFGEVHKAIQKANGKVVALKRILMHNEKEGMPVTALREIKILKALQHPCIINIVDMIVVRSQGKDSPVSVYMVFPYMDHDLAGLLENERVKLTPSHIKLYMRQLLEGTEYMHRNHILHRDMKAANLLISNDGSLRIADFGLARAFDPNVAKDPGPKARKYTNCVVTRWYRPPELLLGARQYGAEIDIWGVGCVLGEMFTRKPILPGSSDIDQLEKIWQLCGTPNQHTWPDYDALPGCEGIKRFSGSHPRRIKHVYDGLGKETCDLLDKLLTCNPRERITAAEALDHDYFWTDPLPADPKNLPTYEASHEFDKRGRRNQAPVAPPLPRNMNGGYHFPPPPPPPPGHYGQGMLPNGPGMPPGPSRYPPFPPPPPPQQFPYPPYPPNPPGGYGYSQASRGHGPGPPPPGHGNYGPFPGFPPHPAHLPPRPGPPRPLGRGSWRTRDGQPHQPTGHPGTGGGGLNYG